MKQHIFFVDDEPKARKVVRRNLERGGLKVSCFACASDCLEQLHSGICDLLIIDVKMPEMDGIELIKEAKRNFPELKVLVISGYGNIPMMVKVMKAGATDFIEKPLNRKRFLLAVESMLKRDFPINPYEGKILTKAELEVLRLILDSKRSEETIDLFDSMKAIEFLRNRIHLKLGVDNLDDLLKVVMTGGKEG